MNCEELMIGDWVNLGIHCENYHTEKVSFENIMEHEWMMPINITEEIMELNGGDGHIIYAYCYEVHYSVSAEGGMYIKIYETDGEHERLVISISVDSVSKFQHALRLCGLNELADNFKID